MFLDFDLKRVLSIWILELVVTVAWLSFRLLSRLPRRLAIYGIPDIDGKRLERMLAHATADTFRTRSIACRDMSGVSFKRADLGGAIKLFYCRTNGKKCKKSARTRARRGLKRFFTCHWPTTGISVLTRGSPAMCRASTINGYHRRFGYWARYLIAPPTLALFFSLGFCFSPSLPSSLFLHETKRDVNGATHIKFYNQLSVGPLLVATVQVLMQYW